MHNNYKQYSEYTKQTLDFGAFYLIFLFSCHAVSNVGTSLVRI